MQWAMAAALIISGLSVFTSCSVDDNPVKREPKTMLVGMDYMGHFFYGDVTYSYTYDDDYRLVKMKEVQVGTDLVIAEFDYIYTPGHITKQGREEGYSITEECSLDDHGRIVEQVRTSVNIETQKALGIIYTYTYDEDGHLTTVSSWTGDDPYPIVYNYTWENGELRSRRMVEATIVVLYEYEPSDVPAQAYYNHIGYKELEELCQQGCFGVLPRHLPSKQIFTMTMDDVVMSKLTTEYDYSVVDGRVVASNDNYFLHWEQK